MAKEAINVIGERFDRIVVLSLNRIEQKGKSRQYFYNCICDCGKEFVRAKSSILRKCHPNKSCGCFSENRLREMRTKHNKTETTLYKKWCGVKGRIFNCNNPKYKVYGGRGIKMCERWASDFVEFEKDMIGSYEEHVKKHGEKNTTLERKNVHGDYTKENCTWATLKEQANNKQCNKPFVATNLKTGEKYYDKSVKTIAERLGISTSHIYCVLKGKRKHTFGYFFEYIK